MPQVQPGSVIAGRYAVLRLLGEGATKKVYLADDKLSQRMVALALLLPKGDADPTLAARFSREGKAASVLRSPYVVQVYDVGKLPDGTRYLATEAVLGRGLDAALAHGAVRPELAVRWTSQVLVALAEAHARGILHRDVKPENVLLEPRPDGEVAKLTDFGLAKVLDGTLEGSFQLRTAQNIVLGTPEYMSPEMWQGGAIDGRADLYATGVMLYELLLGCAPFQSKFLHAMCVSHVTEAPPPFPSNAPKLARALEPAVMRALAKHPGDRFANADAMRDAIRAASGIEIALEAHRAEPAGTARCARAELLCDAIGGVVTLIASPSVVIGRESDAHIVARCLPATEENVLRARTVSRQHARVDWRGGRAYVTDLASRTGTRIGEVPVGSEPAEIRHGDVLALGKHVRMRFEHAPAASGELPRWARLTRIDDAGGGQVHVMVLTEAKISSAQDAAVRLPADRAAGDLVRIRAIDGGLAAIGLGALEASPLVDGQQLRVGSLTLEVAVEQPSRA